MSESLLDFDTWPPGITQASVPANNNARRSEVLAGSVVSASTTAQPGLPAERDIYIIPAGATGLQWATFDADDVAIYYAATWTAFAPFDGLRKFVEDEGEDWQFVGSGGWAPAGGGGAVEAVVPGHGTDVDASDPQNPIVAVDETELDSALIPFAHSGFSSANVEDAIVEASLAGGGGSVAGSDKQVQYNNAGAFGAEAAFEYDAASNTLTVSNITTAGLLLTAASATGGAGLRVPHGAAPTTPTNGDLWTTTAGMFARINGASIGFQPLDSNLTTIAGLTATTDNFIQAKSSAWASRTVAQVAADLNGTGLVASSVGTRIMPQNSQSAAYTLVAADSGNHVFHPSADTTARTFTIPANSSVAYPIGTAVTFVNQNSAGVITIAITTDTMRLAGAGTTGSRTLAANGVATAIKVTSTEWIISGTGLT